MTTQDGLLQTTGKRMSRTPGQIWLNIDGIIADAAADTDEKGPELKQGTFFF